MVPFWFRPRKHSTWFGCFNCFNISENQKSNPTALVESANDQPPLIKKPEPGGGYFYEILSGRNAPTLQREIMCTVQHGFSVFCLR